jgi:two-component system, OmpR family, sensor histidine kinase KdpD
VKEDEYLMAAAEGGPVPFSLRDYLISAGVTVSACIGANFVADAYGEVAAALILVLGIVVTGAIGGLVCALVASAASFLVFNFLIAEPVLTLRLANGRDVTPLVVFSLVGILSGVLAGRLRDRTAAARASNMRLGQLLAFSRALQSATSASDVAATLADVAERTLGVRADLRPANGGQHPAAPLDNLPSQPDGSGDAEDAIRLELEGTSGHLGEIVLRGGSAAKLGRSLSEGLARLVTLALDRAALAERVAEREADLKAEGIRTALLSSVSPSHDDQRVRLEPARLWGPTRPRHLEDADEGHRRRVRAARSLYGEPARDEPARGGPRDGWRPGAWRRRNDRGRRPEDPSTIG